MKQHYLKINGREIFPTISMEEGDPYQFIDREIYMSYPDAIYELSEVGLIEEAFDLLRRYIHTKYGMMATDHIFY